MWMVWIDKNVYPPTKTREVSCVKTEIAELIVALENIEFQIQQLQGDIYYDDCPELWDALSLAQEECAEKIKELKVNEEFGI